MQRYQLDCHPTFSQFLLCVFFGPCQQSIAVRSSIICWRGSSAAGGHFVCDSLPRMRPTRSAAGCPTVCSASMSAVAVSIRRHRPSLRPIVGYSVPVALLPSVRFARRHRPNWRCRFRGGTDCPWSCPTRGSNAETKSNIFFSTKAKTPEGSRRRLTFVGDIRPDSVSESLRRTP